MGRNETTTLLLLLLLLLSLTSFSVACRPSSWKQRQKIKELQFELDETTLQEKNRYKVGNRKVSLEDSVPDLTGLSGAPVRELIFQRTWVGFDSNVVDLGASHTNSTRSFSCLIHT